MKNEELAVEVLKLKEGANKIKHPMLPAGIKAAIVGAAEILAELVRRELDRHG